MSGEVFYGAGGGGTQRERTETASLQNVQWAGQGNPFVCDRGPITIRLPCLAF